MCYTGFQIIGISESRIKLNKTTSSNIQIPNYTIEQCPTESSNGGTLLYIKKDIIYKVRYDHKKYKSKEIESIYIEIIKRNQKNIIVGCIYKHPHMEAYEFNHCYMDVLSEKLLKEKNKEVILMGDFNIDLLKYETNNNSSEFLDIIYSSSLIPRLTSPTRISPRSKTLIDNIFTTDTYDETIAGNLMTSISDHLAQFVIFPNTTNKVKEKDKYQRDFKNFNKNNSLKI